MAAAAVKDFDQERRERNRITPDIKFKIGGVTFKMRGQVRPDIIADAETLGEGEAATTTLETLDGILLGFIDPAGGAHAKYEKIRQDDEDPVTLQDLLSMMWWCIEAYTNRPTQLPSPSTAGRRKTSTRSTAGSRKRASTRKR